MNYKKLQGIVDGANGCADASQYIKACISECKSDEEYRSAIEGILGAIKEAVDENRRKYSGTEDGTTASMIKIMVSNMERNLWR